MIVIRGLIGGLIQIAVMAALLLLPAGTWHWPRALYFLLVYGIANSVAIVVLARMAPASLEARLMKPSAKSQPAADRIITAIFIFLLLAWFAFVGVDAFRLRLLPLPGIGASALGVVLAATGYGLIWTTLFQNAFAAPIVKDQAERGQVLIDTGLYSHIRHPFYLGFLLFLVGVALWLESYASLLTLLALLVCLIARIRVEESTLKQKLPGYADYTERVRYRLVPFLW
jgi:protein-S-isoprenylcysteine O-methyltransferase Ste14